MLKSARLLQLRPKRKHRQSATVDVASKQSKPAPWEVRQRHGRADARRLDFFHFKCSHGPSAAPGEPSWPGHFIIAVPSATVRAPTLEVHPLAGTSVHAPLKPRHIVF
jgi:hypothetical protein